jgi:translation elongation factor EF-Tu-like GTPase
MCIPHPTQIIERDIRMGIEDSWIRGGEGEMVIGRCKRGRTEDNI